MTTTRPLTAEELLMLPETENGSTVYYELIRGELKKMSPTGGTHGLLCMRLGRVLGNYVEENRLGVVLAPETGVLVERDPDTVLGVDVAFVSNERLKLIENFDKFLPFAPDLAVEVLSPSNTVQEMDEKVALYFSGGARAVWVVNTKRHTVAVYSSPLEVRILGEDDVLEGGEVLPGFSYRLSELFPAIG